MKVEKYQFIKANTVNLRKTPTFRQSVNIQSLNSVNIGMLPDGFIGKIRVRTGENAECFLNVIKKSFGNEYENYLVQNDAGNIIGEIGLQIKKYTHYDRWQYPSDPSHVFVSDLKNYSNPATPYYKNSEQYKDIGTRLLQIALKRSYEALCDGNLKLISKNESKEWYKNVIGMTEEFPNTQTNKYGFNIHNPNAMMLPPISKTHLSKLHDGL